MIKVDHLTYSFGSQVVLDDVNLVIQPEEVVVLQGPSGSGKTTLIRLIAGLDIPARGEIRIDGQLVSTPTWVSPPHTRGIGIVFQRSALWPHMTVAGNLRFVMDGLPASEKNSRIRGLLRQAGLESLSGRLPGQLSGGEARRVALLRALAASPRRLLLDEPLTNLNPELKAGLLEFLREYHQEHRPSLLYVTHDLEEARMIGGQVLRLENGRLRGEA
jgi:iron(III) transport system ATP-binding protein